MTYLMWLMSLNEGTMNGLNDTTRQLMDSQIEQITMVQASYIHKTASQLR